LRYRWIAMANALIPYLVNYDLLRGFWGSRNAPEVERIKTVWKSQIAENADVFAHLVQNGAPTLGRALDEICFGQLSRPQFPSQYAYALEILCASFGQKVSNQFFSPVEETWLQAKVDPVLQRWGLGMVFTTRMLTSGVWPLAIPQSTGFPFGGSIAPDELEQALMVMRNGTPPQGLDRQTVMVLGEIRGWLEAAAARRAGLVTFYY
jgi:hypothetical protein